MKKLLNSLLLFMLLLATLGFAKEKKVRRNDLAKSNAAQLSQNMTNRTLVNVGQLAMWIYSNGLSAYKPAGGSGLFFPRGSDPSTATIFQDGLIWGGTVNDGVEPALRVGGAEYAVGHVAGAIISPGVAEDKTDPAVDRVWRIRRDFTTADLTLDAAEFNSIQVSEVTPDQVQQLRDIYRQDWLDWPTEKGAPFYDADGDGAYNPDFKSDGSPKLAPADDVAFDPTIHADEPGYANADQVVWLVTNDLDEEITGRFSGSPPIGLEQQITFWAYDRLDSLGQVIFKQYRLLYKGTQATSTTARIEDMYLGQWSDPDIGNAGDDLVGCDTTLGLGFAYNEGGMDIYYSPANLPPPAAGYDFLSGPLVEAFGSKAVFGLKRKSGYKNLGMTAFMSFAPSFGDPDFGTYDHTLTLYNMLRGFLARPVSPLTPILDPSGQPTKFMFTGDPVKNIGWVNEGGRDQRILLSSGPFTLALGDTQETVIATLAALSSDRLASISLLKFVDHFAQQAFDNLFELPKPPATPVLTASELEGEIFLNWSVNAAAVAETEGFDNYGFLFEGYNIYQLPTASSTIDQSTRIATFDVVNDFTTILQETFDVSLGVILELPRQFGSNSGIQRTLRVSNDVIRGLDLINGQNYYFGVSAYSSNRDRNALLKSLESTVAVVAVVPQSTKPGTRYQSVAGDTLPILHAGSSDGAVTVVVTDQSAITGDSYRVTFRLDSLLGTVWNLENTTTGELLLPNQINQSGDSNYLVTEGFTAMVTDAPNGFKNFGMVTNSAGPLNPPEGAAAASRGFPSLQPTQNQQVGSGRWLFNVGGGRNDGTYASFLSRSLRNDNFNRVIPNDWEMRFTVRGSWALRWFEDDFLVKVPFELWNIGSNTTDDPSDDYRCIPYFLSSGGVGALQTDPAGLTYQLDPNDHGASDGSDDPYTAWIYWIIPREHDDGTPGEGGYNSYLSQIDTTITRAVGNIGFSGGSEAFARTVLVNWNGDDVSDGEVAPGIQLFPERGSVIRITTLKPNTPNDVFTFSTTGYEPTTSTQKAKEDVLARVNVFPNPFMGFNTFAGDFNRKVTFSHLPERATIRIFNLAGFLVRKLEKDNPSQFLTWNLLDGKSMPIASGIYIANIELPDLRITKNLKIALQFLSKY